MTRIRISAPVSWVEEGTLNLRVIVKLVALKIHCVDDTSCFSSTVAAAVCDAGQAAGRTQQKQET